MKPLGTSCPSVVLVRLAVLTARDSLGPDGKDEEIAALAFKLLDRACKSAGATEPDRAETLAVELILKSLFDDLLGRPATTTKP